MQNEHKAVVYGANGHTGRMVALALQERGWSVILAGRNPTALETLAAELGVSTRPASIDSPERLDAAIEGADIVINCASPFRDSAPPLIAAAVRARVPYIGVAAEIEAILDTIERWDAPAREAGVLVVPAMGFYGALGALVAVAALGDWRDADRVTLNYGLNEWIPTVGTLAAGAASRARRMPGTRPVHHEGVLTYTDDPSTTVEWEFPEPVGRQQAVAEITMADTVTLARYVRVKEIISYMPSEAFAGLSSGKLRDGDTDGSLSRQQFVLQAVVTRGSEQQSFTVRGGDIYAITAPLVAIAAAMVLHSESSGVRTAPEFDSPLALLVGTQPVP